MRNFIKTVVVLALLGDRAGFAQTAGTARPPTGSALTIAPLKLTQGARLAGGRPVGHRQPQARDVPSEMPSDLERLSAEDIAVDRRLIICRGC